MHTSQEVPSSGTSNDATRMTAIQAGDRSRRALRSLNDIRDEINLIDDALSALAELLHKIPNEKVHAWSLYVLLKPWHERLRVASCELNDAT